ncbi:hypothetical protein F2Q70_00011870 [Brassica cretica]|uniref:Uncharacterized protein n=1 Tax=Brassica cretica TaxID=69181 RepID=A0A8S9LQP2_BRACR|nr:hypothetical protein F2Q70_00011870 [Brassica cretica]
MLNERRFDTGSTSAAPPPPPVLDRDPWPREREADPIPLFAHFDDPRTAVRSTKCINREIRDEWDDYDRLFYNEWLKVSIEPTRFMDPDVIRRLGIREDLEDMDADGTHLIELPRRSVTVFLEGLASI